MKNTYGSIGAERGVLAETVPHDIVFVSQRQRLLEAMADCCSEKTFAATTISDIVAAAGVSRRTFYKLFANKRECFEAAVNSFAGELAKIVGLVRSGEGTWSDEVCGGISVFLDLLVSKPAFANLALVEAIAVDPTLVGRCWQPLLDALPSGADPGKASLESTDAALVAVGTAQVLIARRMTEEGTDRLHGLLPDLVYIALTPFVGRAEALEQARQAR
ncbi:MAG TPA: helix-turn-helix domain-containing protein [Solirubrobacterales bacterium]